MHTLCPGESGLLSVLRLRRVCFSLLPVLRLCAPSSFASLVANNCAIAAMLLSPYLLLSGSACVVLARCIVACRRAGLAGRRALWRVGSGRGRLNRRRLRRRRSGRWILDSGVMWDFLCGWVSRGTHCWLWFGPRSMCCTCEAPFNLTGPFDLHGGSQQA
jgi:hypothetical protein